MSDVVNHPTHYGGDTPYEVIKVIEARGLGFHLGNAVKYIARAGKKDSARADEDIRKARWYVERHLMLLQGHAPHEKVEAIVADYRERARHAPIAVAVAEPSEPPR